MNRSKRKPSKKSTGVTRRRVLPAGAAATVALASRAYADDPRAAADRAKAAREGRLPQSVVHWCYEKYWTDVDEFCRVTKDLGCASLELIDPKHWPVLKKHGLTCAIAGSHGFVKGMNNPAHWDECLDLMTKRIEACADAGFPSVITFTGMREPSL